MSKSQNFPLYDQPSQMEPLLPGEHALGPLLEQAHELQGAAYKLGGFYAPDALRDLRTLLRAMNSYYTNKIEGQHTLPLEIAQALRGDFSNDADKARRQRLAIAHMACEQQLETRWTAWSAAEVWAPQMVADIHQDLFARLPVGDRLMGGGDVLQPGAWRGRDVAVGRHAAPAFMAVVPMLARWGSYYGGVRRGELQVLAALAAHQRLAWIHPFRDGNGRVARLHTHLVLGKLGLTNGLWSPLRGFARTQIAYYEQLAAADEPRAGDLDGRGNLTEKGLICWISYALQTCLDQVQFMDKALRLDTMRDRMAACLAFEENAVKQGVRTESLRGLHYLFATQAELERSEFKALLSAGGLGERLGTAQVSALLKRGLLATDSPHGKLRLGVPQHALRFYFPNLWPEAETDAR
jgi:Fic family protein